MVPELVRRARGAFEEAALGARFLWRVPFFLRRPLGLAEAEAILRDRLEHREHNLLTLIQRAVYANPASPYRSLLEHAGCEYGDLERLVDQEGVEGALGVLYQRGVYLTGEEFKGRQPVVRGSASLAVDPASLRNPAIGSDMVSQSSGSRGERTEIRIDLATLRERAVAKCLIFHASGVTDWPRAIWGVPGSTTLQMLLQFAIMGAPLARWFSQVDPAAPGLHPRYRWSARALRLGGLLAGVPVPRTEYVPLDRSQPILHWMATVLRGGQHPVLHTFASAAVRVCEAASQAGVELGGAEFSVGGEPITAARLAAIQRSGANVRPVYASSGCGTIARACQAPDAPDDVHLLHDLHALTQPGASGESRGLPADTLLISSLRPTTPVVLLNVSLGDRASIVTRRCNCPLERLGWSTHLWMIRSFEKLTAGGMTFLDTDLVRVLEELLPARFGGGPTDYQLVEEETDDGQPSLRLLVPPGGGPLDSEAVAATFLEAIGAGSPAQRVMALQWRQAGLPRVERCSPLTPATGKILHLHAERRRPGQATSPQTPLLNG